MPKNDGNNMKRSVSPTIAGAVLALSILGVFLALDRTVLHWYTPGGENAGSTTSATPIYSTHDVLSLTLTQFSRSPVPQGIHSIHCYETHYLSPNHTWVVRCGYWATKPAFPTPGVPDHPPDYPQTFSFDDTTGAIK